MSTGVSLIPGMIGTRGVTSVSFDECLKVSVDLLIRLPAVPDMLLFIDDFDIEKHVIYKIDDFEYRGQTEVPAGFHSCSIPFSLAHFTHFLNEFRMQKGSPPEKVTPPPDCW